MFDVRYNPPGGPEITIFDGVPVARSLFFSFVFVDRCLSFCPLSFCHHVFCPSSIYLFIPSSCFVHIISRSLE
jgi:hypothetical protein